MNKLIAGPKQHFLLGASLDILHQESNEWLETIAFWKDEMNFFHKLLHLQDPIFKEDKNYETTVENLQRFQGQLISQLEKDVVEHEKLLSKLERNQEGISDWDYREKHRRIKTRMETMMSDFKSFKKVVFGFVEKLRS